MCFSASYSICTKVSELVVVLVTKLVNPMAMTMKFTVSCLILLSSFSSLLSCWPLFKVNSRKICLIWTFVFTSMILIDISCYLRFDYRCVRWTSRSTWKRENQHGKQLFHLWFRKRIFRYSTTWFRYSCPTGAQSC